jgi:hypothetical protein
MTPLERLNDLRTTIDTQRGVRLTTGFMAVACGLLSFWGYVTGGVIPQSVGGFLFWLAGILACQQGYLAFTAQQKITEAREGVRRLVNAKP